MGGLFLRVQGRQRVPLSLRVVGRDSLVICDIDESIRVLQHYYAVEAELQRRISERDQDRGRSLARALFLSPSAQL